MNQTEKKIYELISNQFHKPVEELHPDTSFKRDLNADSLDLVELVMAMELELGMEAQDGDLDQIKTVGDVVEYVNRVTKA